MVHSQAKRAKKDAKQAEKAAKEAGNTANPIAGDLDQYGEDDNSDTDSDKLSDLDESDLQPRPILNAATGQPFKTRGKHATSRLGRHLMLLFQDDLEDFDLNRLVSILPSQSNSVSTSLPNIIFKLLVSLRLSSCPRAWGFSSLPSLF